MAARYEEGFVTIICNKDIKELVGRIEIEVMAKKSKRERDLLRLI